MRTVDPVKHEQKRRDILKAATRCFRRDGFQQTPISKICAEAKISPGHLYYYFKSKDAIIEAMIDTNLGRNESRIRTLTAQPDPVAAFTDEIEHVLTRRNVEGRAILFDLLSEAARRPAMAALVRKHASNVRILVAKFLRDAQLRGEIDASLDPDAASAILMSLSDGVRCLAVSGTDIEMEAVLKTLRLLMTRFLSPATELAAAAPMTTTDGS